MARRGQFHVDVNPARLAEQHTGLARVRRVLITKTGDVKLVDGYLTHRLSAAFGKFGDDYVGEMSARIDHIFELRDKLSGRTDAAIRGETVHLDTIKQMFGDLTQELDHLVSPKKSVETRTLELPPERPHPAAAGQPVAPPPEVIGVNQRLDELLDVGLPQDLRAGAKRTIEHIREVANKNPAEAQNLLDAFEEHLKTRGVDVSGGRRTIEGIFEERQGAGATPREKSPETGSIPPSALEQDALDALDINDLQQARPTPGGQPLHESTEAGLLVHAQRNAEALRAQLGNAAIPAAYAGDAAAGRIITLDQMPDYLLSEQPLGVTSRVDRITRVEDPAAGVIYELKPNTENSIKKGLAQGERYANLVNSQGRGGRRDWRSVVVVYDAERARAFIPLR